MAKDRLGGEESAVPEEEAGGSALDRLPGVPGLISHAVRGDMPSSLSEIGGILAGPAGNAIADKVTGAFGLLPSVAETADPAAGTPPPTLTIGAQALGNISASEPQARSFARIDERNAVQGKGGGISGTVQMDITPPVPGDLIAQQMAIAKERAKLEYMYQQERARSLGVMVDIETEFADAVEKGDEKTLKQIDGLLNEAENEAYAIDELIRKAEANHINPGQFFANVGAAGSFAAALAVGSGAMASAFGGGPNVALKLIGSAIERNVRAQIVNQNHDRSLIGHRVNLANMVRGLADDRAQYGNYLRASMLAMARARAGIEVNRLGSAQAKLAAKDVFLRLGAALTESRIKAITNSAARVTWKVKSLAQARQVMAMQQQAAKPVAAQGRGRSTKKAGAADRDALMSALDRASKVFDDTGDAKQAVKLAAAKLQQELGPSLRGRHAQALVETIKYVAENQPDEISKARLKALANEASKLTDTDFRPPDVYRPLGKAGNVGFHVVDKTLFDKNYPKDSGGLDRAAQQVADIMELKRLLNSGTSIQPDLPIIRDMMLDIDGDVTFKQFFSGDKATDKARNDQLVNKMVKAWHLQNAEGTRNALNLEWERRFAAGGAGVQVSMFQFIMDAIGNNPSIRIGRLGSNEEEAVVGLRQTAAKMGLSTDFGL